MSPTSRKPLFLALFISLILTTGLSLLLYFNEDLRQSTFVLLEKVINEEGEEEVRVKIEKPKPNEAQVREIARNKEKKKEESLKEKAKDIRKSLTEIERASDELKEQLNAFSDWDRLLRMARDIERVTKFTGNNVRVKEPYPTLPASAQRFMALTEKSRKTLEAYTEQEPEPMEVFGLFGDSKELTATVRQVHAELEEIDRKIHKNTRRHQFRYERDWLANLRRDTDSFLKELERVVYARAPYLEPSFEADTLVDSTLPQDIVEELAMEGILSEEQMNSYLEDMTGEPFSGELAGDPVSEDMEGFWLDQLPTDEQLNAMNVGQLYESIQEMTELGDQIYAENRAAELANAEQIPLGEAREQVFAPQTNTGPDLQAQLQGGTPSNLEQFEQYSDALNQAERAAAAMARTAGNRSEQVRPGSQNQDDSRTARQIQQAMAQRASAVARMNAMASNQGLPDGNVQDMRGLMMQAYSAQSGGGSAGMENYGTVLSHTHQTDLNVLGGEGVAAAKPRAVRLNTSQVMRQAIPGRRLTSDAKRKGWIFLDTWYIIGPWQRPSRNSFATRFPPEIEVNLDETYEGKRHPRSKEPLNLEWRFVQTENIRVNPPDEMSDSVYYAYTEVFADRAMEVVVAVASDDIAKLWVNDLVVWEDEGLSPWRLDEGFRRILLKPGYNKVLCRVENGPVVCYFSVLFSPVDGLNLD